MAVTDVKFFDINAGPKPKVHSTEIHDPSYINTPLADWIKSRMLMLVQLNPTSWFVAEATPRA